MKCVVVGTEDVGKTCLVLVFQDNTFPTKDAIPKVMDAVDIKVVIDNKSVAQLDMWDTAGQDEYDSIRRYMYKDADIFILCFSINSREAFEAIGDKWYAEIRRQMPNAPILLLGTKSDLRFSKKDGKCVSMTEAIKLAKKIGATAYTECSAKLHTNVDSVLKQAAKIGLKIQKIEKKSLWGNIRAKMSSQYSALFHRDKAPDISDAELPYAMPGGVCVTPAVEVVQTEKHKVIIELIEAEYPEIKHDVPDFFGDKPTPIPASMPSGLPPRPMALTRKLPIVKKMKSFEDLPPAIVEKIFQFLPPVDLAICCMINKINNEVANSDGLWAHHCRTLDPSFTLGEGEDSPKLVYQILAHGWENDFTTEPEPVAPEPTKWFYFF